MRKLVFERTTFVSTTPEIAWDNVSDFSHFKWCHRKHFQDFEVVWENGSQQVFFYSSRIIYPFPFLKRYIAYREMDHSQKSFRQIYKDVKSGSKTFFSCQVKPVENGVHICNKMIFEVGGILSFFPGLIASLWNRRLHLMWVEDREILVERTRLGAFDNPKCCPETEGLAKELAERFADEIRLPTQYHFNSN